MKKILALAVGMLLIPFTAFGMEAMSDGDMDSITGQTGVAISLQNIQIFTSGADELWFETGDPTTSGSYAAVGLVGNESVSYTFINKIANPANLGDTEGIYTDADGVEHGTLGTDTGTDNELLRGDYGGLADIDLADKGARQDPSVLGILVKQHSEFGVFGDDFSGTGANGAYVSIILPTLEIYSAAGSVDQLQIFVMGEDAYGGDDDTNPVGSGGVPANAGYSLGTIWTSGAGSTTAILGGEIGITSLGQLN